MNQFIFLLFVPFKFSGYMEALIIFSQVEGLAKTVLGTDPRRYTWLQAHLILAPEVIWFSFLSKREKGNYFFVVGTFPTLYIKSLH